METANISVIDIKLVIALVVWISVLMLVANAADIVANPESGVLTSHVSTEQATLVPSR